MSRPQSVDRALVSWNPKTGEGKPPQGWTLAPDLRSVQGLDEKQSVYCASTTDRTAADLVYANLSDSSAIATVSGKLAQLTCAAYKDVDGAEARTISEALLAHKTGKLSLTDLKATLAKAGISL